MSKTATQAQQIANTIKLLVVCQEARRQGYPVSLKTDPSWLVNMAINRRAGWPESRYYFGSCQPINGVYPKRADENHDSTQQFVRRVNTPYLMIREQEIPRRYRTRLAHRIWREDTP